MDMNYDIYILTPGGVEGIAGDEVCELGCRVEYVERGLVKARGSIRDVINLNLWGRTFTMVLLGVCEGEFRDLDDIVRTVSRADFTPYFRDGYSFAVRCSRAGEHSFTSIDAAREVGGVIHRSLLDSGLDIRVDLDNPTIEFILRIHEDRFHLGVNTSGEGLNRRGYRVYSHPAALNPVLASAMIRLLGWRGEKILIDPMSGGATIPIEAVLKALEHPPGLYRERHPLADIPFIGEDEYLRAREEALKRRKKSSSEIAYAVEISEKHLSGGVRNAESAGVRENIRFILGDSTRLSKYVEEGDYIYAFNPPYGIRGTRREALPRLYRETLKELARVGAGRGAIITAAEKILGSIVKSLQMKISRRIRVMHGGLETTIYIIET
jgi:tRNA (guanine6-N2)-methyltransferase